MFFKPEDLEEALQNRLFKMGGDSGFFTNLGRQGSYIFASSHDGTKDVPLETRPAFIELIQNQIGFLEQ